MKEIKKDKWYYIRVNQITSKGWGMTFKCDLTFDSFEGPDFCFDCSVINTAHSNTDSLCTNSSCDKPANLLDTMLWLIFGWKGEWYILEFMSTLVNYQMLFFAIFLLVANLLVCSWVINTFTWTAHLGFLAEIWLKCEWYILEFMSTLVNYFRIYVNTGELSNCCDMTYLAESSQCSILE